MKEVDYLYRYQGQKNAKEIKKARYVIENFSKKDLSNIIRECEILSF